MDYTKLLFAAEVRRLAGEIRNGAHGKAYRDSMLEGDEKKRAHEAWLKENPLMNFVPQAIASISAVAEMIEPIHTSPEL